MTRQDELNEAWCSYMGKFSTEIMQALAFALRWADEHRQIDVEKTDAWRCGYKEAVEKACEWLEENAYLYCDDEDALHESALIGDFRHVMKGGE